jgi:hypothetical protein
LLPLMQALWGIIWTYTVEKSKKWPSRGRWYAPTCDFWLYC